MLARSLRPALASIARLRIAIRSIAIATIALLAVAFLTIASTLAAPGSARAIGRLTATAWGTASPANPWIIQGGRFTADARADLFAYQTSFGGLYVWPSTGSSFDTSTVSWATVSPAGDWQFAGGEFTGDALSDVVGYHPSNGSVWIGTNTGGSFSFFQRATLSPASGWLIHAGQFGGDARTDVAVYSPATGAVRVAINAGGGLVFQSWATLAAPAAWNLAAGDYTGDGLADLAGYQVGVGALALGANTGAAFDFQATGQSLASGIAWQLDGGDYDVDGDADLFAYDPTTGNLLVGRSQGGAFDFALGPWRTVAPPGVWQFVPGDFDGDGENDAAGHATSNGSLWFFRRAAAPVEGYAWPLSAAPGETIEFMASGAGDGAVGFYRASSLGPDVDLELLGTTSYVPTIQPTQAEPWKNGAGWSPSFSLEIPDGWRSGIYVAKLHGLDGIDFHVPFIVKAPPSARPTVAVIANVNTWLAYNDWGGRGKYDGAAEVSHLRPNPRADPVASGFHPEHLARAELWILGWLDAEGYRPHVFTDIDFHDGEVGTRYANLVIGTHPEYYTVEGYDRLQEHLGAGGSLLYIGGNGVFEIGSFIAGSSQTRMRFLNGVENGLRDPAWFRTQGSGGVATRPERAILGMSTEACGAPGAPFQPIASQVGHPIFAGTGMTAGTLFGDVGYNTAGGLFNGMASAFEVDTSAGPGALGCPSACVPCSFSTLPSSSLPPGHTVVARATVTPGAEIVHYDHPAGGHVVSIGSITAGGSLVVDPTLAQIARNALGPPVVDVPIFSRGMILVLIAAICGIVGRNAKRPAAED